MSQSSILVSSGTAQAGLLLPLFLLALLACSTATAAADTTPQRPTTESLYLRPQDVAHLAGHATTTDPRQDQRATTDQWMSLGETVEFLPASHHKTTLSMNLGLDGQTTATNNGRVLDDAEIRKWAAQQLQKNRDQQDAMRAVGNSHQRQQKQQQQQQPSEEQEQHRNLESSSSSSTSSTSASAGAYKLSPFVEGESDYDEYQQAWRLLGFMIDCDDDISNWMTDDYYNQQGDNNNRGSGDQGTGDMCTRYVLWAAYIDLDYQGGGIGEYQYWDKYSNSWNENACQVEEGSRCAKMDCHLDDTHWSLLGLFKHRSMDDWMEQLFKHEGACVWTDDEYDFMSDAREAWPEGCIASGQTTEDGDAIYYATKPLAGAKITIGLYTDTRCVEEYVPYGSDDPLTVENVVGNVLAEGGSGDSGDNNNNGDDDVYSSYETTLAKWDEALDTFRTCQPCVAYDVNNYGYNFDDDARKGSAYGTYTYGYDDDYRYNYYYGNGNVQGTDFDCYDDADYTNVNQCMKFMAKTEMNTASFRDLLLADKQGTLMSNPLENYMNSKNEGWIKRRRNSTSAFGMWFWFICSALLLGYAYISFTKVQKHTNYRLPKFQMNLKQPLVFA